MGNIRTGEEVKRMPKSNFLKTESVRMKYEARAQAGIRRYMSLRRITDDKIAAKQKVQARTIQNRIKDPGSMQLRDLWDLAEILDAPVGELAGGDLPEEMMAKLMQMKFD